MNNLETDLIDYFANNTVQLDERLTLKGHKYKQNYINGDIVKSVKGPHGGYKTSTKAANTTLNDFFEILEGPTAIMDCYFDSGCDHLTSCNIRTPINKINNSIRNLFDNLTLADIS